MSYRVRPKKSLGQHFLHDENVVEEIVTTILKENYSNILEVGPGMGVLTKYLIKDKSKKIKAIEIDRESVSYLKSVFPEMKEDIIEADYLKYPINDIFGHGNQFLLAGNFPYNISSQILFKVLEFKNEIPVVIGMFQKEVANRIAAVPGNKQYGIISVFIQAYYEVEYLFTVSPECFTPPPKVMSGVIRLVRNSRKNLLCDEKLFVNVVKTVFNQRRKMLRNTLKPFIIKDVVLVEKYLKRRPEELSVDDFILLTSALSL